VRARIRHATFIAGALAAGTLSLVRGDDRLVRTTEPLAPEAEQAVLHVPDGFEVTLFASEPMINKPINLAVDERGRVWVSSNVEYPYAAEKDRWADETGSRVHDSRDAIKILEDTNGDGRADRAVDFADGLNIPTGVVPWHREGHHDGCIAWSIPNIWYFADTDGDGRCDLREVLFGPLGYERDTHGMCSSFRFRDGWVYATHGFNNTSRLVAKDGGELRLHSGNVFRFRPDGSSAEIWSWGQVNPFGLCFDRRGNLYSADCHSSPVYQLLRGAHYPSFGKPHDGLGFGPAMIEHSHGSTGIAGIVYIDRGIWGPEWDDHVLIGNPVNSRVNLDRVEFDGSTPRAVERPDFIASDDPWFRPVDLALGPDGALYVADFYNRIIGHYEVPLDHPGRDRERGRIWRIVKKSDASKAEPVPGPAPAVNDLREALLGGGSPFHRREAAARLQEHPDSAFLGHLERALAETPAEDTHLRHALRLAIRDTLKLPGAFTSLSGDGPEIPGIALAVPTPEAARYLLEMDPDRTASQAGDFAGKRRRHIARFGSTESLGRLVERERASSASDSVALLEILEGMQEREEPIRPAFFYDWARERAEALLALRDEQGPGTWIPRPHPGHPDSTQPWVIQPRQAAGGGEVKVLSSLSRGEKGAEQRTGILRSRPFAAPSKLEFLVCGHRGHPGKDAHEKNLVRLVEEDTGSELRRAFPPRNDTAQPVSWDLSDIEGTTVRLEIVDGDNGPSYAWLGVTRVRGIDLPVGDFAELGNTARSLRSLAEVLSISAPADLRDRLREFLPPPPPAPPREISKAEQQRLDTIIAGRVDQFDADLANPGRGAELFRLHCAVCHQVSGEGGLVGPQLDGIGSRGAARVAEDILDPNRNVDAHFRVTSLRMKDGTVTGGFVVAERGEILQLVDAAGVARRVPVSEIDSRETSGVSLMPPSFSEILDEDSFRDLLGWLLGK
jgi:putative heme-binding domain-containing protein